MTRTYEQRVRAYEAEGMTRSDAQGIVDLEDMRASKAPTPERLRCEVCDMPTLGDTLCNLHYEEQENAMTPTPWTVKGRYYGDQFRAEWIEPNICEMVSSRSPEETTANAAFIVRACNAHEELVNALETIEGQLEQHPDADKGNSKVHYCLHMAKQALEQAK